jgi:two-component system, NtrC family, sensor kinase
MTCPRCQHEHPPTMKFCGECGSPLQSLRTEGGHTPPSYAELARDLSEAREQQRATSDLLKVIGSSTFDLQPVFETLAENGVRLCGAKQASVFRFDGQVLRVVATHNASRELRAFLEQNPIAPGRQSGSARAALERRTVHILDAQCDPEYTYGVVGIHPLRTVLAAPMLRGEDLLGVIFIYREEVRPFNDSEIALLETFADQAVIAIENVRLFTELQGKNRALTEAHGQVTEALEQQTATSDILRAISSSQADVQPVFDTIVQSSVRLCDGVFGGVFRVEDDMLHLVADHNFTPDAREVYRQVFPMALTPNSRRNASARAVIDRAVINVSDIPAEPGMGLSRRLSEALRFRAILSVPMLRDGIPIGAITVARASAGLFSEKHVNLLKTFADQAVIAIENVRLFKELEARTTALTRSVEQLTALGEVGRAVSSTLDLETVLTTIVSRAVQLSGLDGGVVFEYDEETEEFVQRVATETGGALAETRRTTRIRKGEGALGRTAIALEPVQVPDITVPGAYESRLRENLIESGIRAILAVPMVREGQLIGCLAVTRNQPGDFPIETIDLLRTFTTQSALAIQNARLFREIADKSRQLEAASRHKSEFLANMSHELRTPLNAIIGFSEVLNERMFGELNEKQDEYLKDIYASGQHLLSLINDILDLSKIEAGRMELELAEFSLPVAIDNALTLVRERASRRGIKLGQTINEGVGLIRGDERKVKQVLLNLLSNALKFTPEGGRIDVRAAMNDGMAEISVADTGVGIAPEDQEAIFEEFRQVGTADKKVEGTGLGLALSRKFIELHGGRIWVHSQPGKGSTFSFTLPAS